MSDIYKKDNNKSKKTGSGLSRNLMSLKNYSQQMAAKTEIEEIDNLSEKGDSVEYKSSGGELNYNSNNDIQNLLFHAKNLKNNKAEGRVTLMMRKSIKDLLFDLKMIPEFRQYGMADILGAALKVFVENNRKTLKKKVELKQNPF